GDSQPQGEGLDRQPPDPGRRLVRRPSGSDGAGHPPAEARRAGGGRVPRQDQRLDALAGRWQVLLTLPAHRLETLGPGASDGDKRCPITLTVRARLASPRPISPTSSRLRSEEHTSEL